MVYISNSTYIGKSRNYENDETIGEKNEHIQPAVSQGLEVVRTYFLHKFYYETHFYKKKNKSFEVWFFSEGNDVLVKVACCAMLADFITSPHVLNYLVQAGIVTEMIETLKNSSNVCKPVCSW